LSDASDDRIRSLGESTRCSLLVSRSVPQAAEISGVWL
jgi:hypothetical protein